MLIHGHIVSLIKSTQMTKSRSFNAYSSRFNYAKENRLMLLDKDGLVSRGLVHFFSYFIYEETEAQTRKSDPPKGKELPNISFCLHIELLILRLSFKVK